MNETEESYKLLVVVGPSGVGKGTLIKEVMKDYPDAFGFSVSHTTRLPREGEIDGKNYYFVTKEEFQSILNDNGFVEYNIYNGNYYGTSKQELERLKKEKVICIVEIDINGAMKISNANIPANFVAIYPPDVATLKTRLIGRGSEDEATIEARVKLGTGEMEKMSQSGLFNVVVINDDISHSYPIWKAQLEELYPTLLGSKEIK